MRQTRIKICGLTRAEDVELAGQLGAWAVGFIFVPGTPRYIDEERALAISATLPSSVRRVGVFLNERLDVIERTAEIVGLDLIQLHGNETMDECRQLGLQRVVKAITLDSKDDLDKALSYETAYLLVDKAKASRAETIDWSLAKKVVANHPRVILAGGLTAENVARGIEEVNPWGVDVASGVEARPGQKHHGALRAFFAAVVGSDTAGE